MSMVIKISGETNEKKNIFINVGFCFYFNNQYTFLSN